MVYNEELKRKIPAGWDVRPIADLMARSKNGDWGKSSSTDGYQRVYCVRGTDIDTLNDSAVLNPPIRYISSSHADRLLASNDLIVEISGGSPSQSTGRIAYIDGGTLGRFNDPLVCSNFCKAITPTRHEYSPIIKHYWDSLFNAGVFFNYEGKTSGIKNLLFDQLTRDLNIALPEEDALTKRYYEIFSKSNATIQNNLTQNQNLTATRDWLLPMLMNGQIKFS